MLRYLSRRLLLMIPTFLGITLITFFMIQLAPGDPAAMKIQMEGGRGNPQLAAKIIEETRVLYGLDQPIYIQYGKWLHRLVTLDFGESYVDHQPVLTKITRALPITLLLNFLTIIIIYIISVPLGVIAAIKPQSCFDYGSSVLLFILYSLPAFWVAAILMAYLAGGDYFNWFPIMGISSLGANQLLSPWQYVVNVTWHLVLPVICLTYGGFAFLSRFARSAMLEVIRQDYIRTAWAKGLSAWAVIMRHGFRNALIPMVTLMGGLLPGLLGGSVIIEQIFSIPGMGRLGFQAILQRDYPLIMAIAVIDAVLTLISLLVSDILYAVVDPRIRYGDD